MQMHKRAMSNQTDEHQMTIPSPEHSEETFYLIDRDGFRRVPRIINARDGRRGFAIHPTGKGNDTSAAHFTADLKTLVQEVVMNGKGVRTRAKGGPKEGQQNTLYLSGSSIRGYWLHPDYLDWVKGGVQPEAPVRMASASSLASPAAGKAVKALAPTMPPALEVSMPRAQTQAAASQTFPATPRFFRTIESINFADHCCQGNGSIGAGSFSIDDLTMAREGSKRLRFSPLGNRPEHPLVALVGITPGGQIEKFAEYLSTMDLPAAASKAAFAGAQTVIKQILSAHGLAQHIGLTLQGDLNDNHDILTTSIVKCCLMVDENYKFKAPDIASSPAARHCATTRLVKELSSYPTLKWVVIFGDPGWDALHELQLGNKSIINTLLELGLKVVKLPHFAQNFQQRELYTLSDEQAQRVIAEKPEWAKFAPAAARMRDAVFKAMATAV